MVMNRSQKLHGVTRDSNLSIQKLDVAATRRRATLDGRSPHLVDDLAGGKTCRAGEHVSIPANSCAPSEPGEEGPPMRRRRARASTSSEMSWAVLDVRPCQCHAIAKDVIDVEGALSVARLVLRRWRALPRSRDLEVGEVDKTRELEGRPSQRMVETSHYAVLRVPVNATPDQIRAAYKRRAIETHPDKTNDDGEAFKAVQAAYTILQDASRRAWYDREQVTPPRPPFAARAAADEQDYDEMKRRAAEVAAGLDRGASARRSAEAQRAAA